MAEHRTRYNQLLGIPNEIKDPDLYQLLGLARGGPLDGLDGAYRENMSTLQRIRSPKHKSFIEFLKGELRRAKTTLSDARKRAAYDAQLLSERRSRVEAVLDVVMADGFLTPLEEARALDLAAQSGLLADEAQLVIEEQLERRGARRVDQHVTPSQAPRRQAPHPSAPRRQAPRRPAPRRPAGQRPRPRQPARGQPSVPPVHQPRAATDSDIQDAIARKLGFGSLAPPSPPEPEVVAEVAAPPPLRPAPPNPSASASSSGWGQTAQHPSVNTSGSGSGWGAAATNESGWGAAATGSGKAIGVCGSCLAEVKDHELKAGAEKLPDGRLHCKACASQLRSGTLCGRCYQRFSQSDLRGGQVATHKSRAYHRGCIR